MSDVFYTKVAEKASQIITKFGRQVTLVAESRTPADPTKPWESPSPAEVTFELYGAFVPPNTVRQFGITALGLGTEFSDLMEMSEQVVILNNGNEDIRKYRIIRDSSDNADWGIIGIQQLKPGNIGIISFVGVRR